MADEATLLVRIKTILDKSSIMSNIKEIGNKVQEAVGVGGGAGSGGSNAKKGNSPLGMIGSGVMKGLGGIGKLVGLAGKIFAGVSVGMAVLDVFKPAITIATAIVKQVAEFIRPISDIFVMLLSPILVTLRPIVQMFRVLMQPFKQIAVSGLAAANLLISKGMKVGGEAGGAMVGAGFQGAISSASLMMSGFLQATVGKLLGGVEAFGIGDAITKAFDAWESQALEGIMKVQLKADLVKDLGKSIESIDASTLKDSFKTINQYVEELSDKVGGFTVENFKDNIGVAQTSMDTVFAPLVELLSPGGDIQVYVDKTTEIMKGMGAEFMLTSASMSTSIQGVMKEWQEAIDAMNPGAAGNLAKAGMPSLMENLRGIKETSVWEKAGDYIWAAIKSGGDLSKADISFMGDWVEDVGTARDTMVNEYMAMFPQMTADQKTGLEEQLINANLYSGYISTAALNGFKLMDAGSQEFAKNLNNASKDIVSMSKIASKATADALASAKRAEKAANRSRSGI